MMPERTARPYRATALDDRAVLALSGPDTVGFLQGLVTNDVTQAGPERALYAALLTPQGKLLHDFLLCGRDDDTLWLECEAARRADLMRRLTLYRLRAKVEIVDLSDEVGVFAVFGPGAPSALGLPDTPGVARPFAGGMAFTDPRDPALGVRVIGPRAAVAEAIKDTGIEFAERVDYDRARLALGIAEGADELQPEKSFPLEFGFDALNGVSFSKGCYVGQEVTVRMKKRALVKKHAVPVVIEGDAPDPGVTLSLDGKAAGVLCAAADGIGLALIATDVLSRARAEARPLTAGKTQFRVLASGWDSHVRNG